jgi:hypothetical protein
MKMFPVEFSAGNDSIILFFHLAVAIIFLICCGIADERWPFLFF